MLKNKFIDLLKKFSAKETRLFNDLVVSPFFNKDEDVTQLWHSIKSFGPRYVNKGLERKALYKKAFPDRAYNEKEIGYLISNLMVLAERFCAVYNFENDSVKSHFYALNDFAKKGLDKHYNGVLRDAAKAIGTNKKRNANYYYDLHLIQKAEGIYFNRKGIRTNDESLQKTIDNLDIYYLSEKLKYSCEILNRKNILSVDYKIRLLDETMAFLEAHPEEQVPAIAVYYRILKSLMEPNETVHFGILKEYLDSYLDQFNKDEARDIYLYAINYAVRKINTGNTSFQSELYLLYKTAIEKELILTDGQLSAWSYKNMVSIALRVKEYEWVEQFIIHYQEKLDKNIQDNAYRFSMANLYYHKQMHREGLQELMQVEFTDVYYHLDSKVLLLKIHYESNETDALEYHIEAFKAYLKRNKKVSDNMRNIYLNLLKYTFKAFAYKKENNLALEKLKQEVKEHKSLPDKQWLIDRINEKLNIAV